MTDYKMNRMANCHNEYQDKFKRVLCVCSAGLLRSPTAATILSQPPYNYNTRSAGLVEQFALIPVDEVLIEWADEVVCMDEIQKEKLSQMTDKRIVCLNISDDYMYMENELINQIKERYPQTK